MDSEKKNWREKANCCQATGKDRRTDFEDFIVCHWATSMDPKNIQEWFTMAKDVVENHRTRRILGTLQKEDMEFMDCQEDYTEAFNQAELS